MRVARLLGASLLVLVGLSGPAHAIGLYVERLDDTNVNFCPVCHRVIVPGGIHENAEDVIATELGGALIDAGISYTQEPGETRSPQRAYLPLSGTAGGRVFRGATRECRLPCPSL